MPQPEEWGYQVMIGAMLSSSAIRDEASYLSGGACDPDDVDATLRLVLPVLLNGIRGAKPMRRNPRIVSSQLGLPAIQARRYCAVFSTTAS
jgi:hypothetical protein